MSKLDDLIEALKRHHVTGAGELAAMVGSGMAGDVVGGLRGLGTLAATQDPAKASEAIESTRDAMTYMPRTEARQRYAQVLAGLPAKADGLYDRYAPDSVKNAVGQAGEGWDQFSMAHPAMAAGIVAAPQALMPEAREAEAGMKAAAREGVSPETMRDLVLSRKRHAGFDDPAFLGLLGGGAAAGAAAYGMSGGDQ
jgi:hypothetical protein